VKTLGSDFADETGANPGSVDALGQLLKLVGVVESGGEARGLLAGGDVRVNGQVDVRRGRKLVAGDLVEIAGAEPWRITVETASEE